MGQVCNCPTKLPACASQAQAAIHQQGSACDVVGASGAEKRGRLADVLRRSQPAPGELGALLADSVVAEALVLAGGVDPAGLDDVDVDTVRQQLGGDGAGHVVQPALAGVVSDAPDIRYPGM